MRRSFFRNILLPILLVSVLFNMCSCNLEESYKEFVVDKISEYDVQEYFVSDELDFARVDDVVIIPEIKEIHHGEYIIYISAYSERELKDITIKSVSLKTENKIILESKSALFIHLEKNQDKIFEGWIDCGTFTEDDVEVFDGTELFLTLQLQTEKGAESITEEINYVIRVKIYKSWVTPV